MKLIKLIFAAVVASLSAQADETRIPEPFRGSTESSPIEVDYSDWSLILRNTVIGPKRSSRRASSLNSSKAAPTGSRISRRNTSDTRNEGNRINLRELSSIANIQMLTEIKESLEKVPADAPLKLWRKQEQLAYWLNIYNITLIEQMAKEYPFRKLKKKKNAKDGIWARKTLNISGVALSLNDIQYTIIPNKWDTTLTIYGLYQGYIGGPSIQKQAFTGKNVHTLLNSSAREFVNSNRGAKAKGKTLRVAKFYEENASLFPSWESDVKKHILQISNRNIKADIENTRKIKFLKTDYNTTDLYAGGKDAGTSQSNNSAALTFATVGAGDTFGASGEGGQNTIDGTTSMLDRLRDKTDGEHMNVGIPRAMREYITNMRRQEMRRKGDVRIEVVDEPKPDNPDKK